MLIEAKRVRCVGTCRTCLEVSSCPVVFWVALCNIGINKNLLLLPRVVCESLGHQLSCLLHRDAVWEACFAALSAVPRLLRLVLQALRVCDLCKEELPLLAQILSLLLQHAQLRNHVAANAALLQTIIQDLTVNDHAQSCSVLKMKLLTCIFFIPVMYTLTRLIFQKIAVLIKSGE